MEMKDLVLGPPGYTKIALLGTAAASMELAPFKDQSWAIWACSPGTYSICAKNRSDVFFETHRWMPTPAGQFGAPGTKPWFSPEFHKFLGEHKGPVFMSAADPSIPTSVRIPFEDLIQKHGPYFWTSSIAYMLAMAIEVLAPRAQAGEEVAIGLWGIDMAATEEWAYQRPGCQHFLGLAASLGIRLVVPIESDLMRPPTMYGIGELNPRHIRLSARLAECNAQRANLVAQQQQIVQRVNFIDGQVAELNYMLGAWTDDIQEDLGKAVSFSGQYGRKDAVLAPESSGAEVVALEVKAS